MIPTPVEARDMAELLLEDEPAVNKPAKDGDDCGNPKCYKYRHCWACVEWMGCKGKTPGGCFRCDRIGCSLDGKKG